MHRTRFLRIARIGIVGFAPLATLAACHKELTAEAIEKSPAAIPERGPSGTSTWIVEPDGAVHATLKGPDGARLTQPVQGTVAFAAPNGPPTTVPVQYDPKSGVLTAAGPKLAADITPVRYDLTVGGAPWNGSIDVPKGGTEDLVDTGKLQVTAPTTGPGPNGGVVEMVGPDRVELVADKNDGDVRAYVLDADNKPIDPGDRKITVAFEGNAPQVLALAPEPQGHFVVGHLAAPVDPVQVTVAVNDHGATHACLVGWAPGSVVVVGPEAPPIPMLAVDPIPGAVVEVRHHGRHGGDVVVGAPGVVVDTPGVVVGAPGVVVAPPSVVVNTPGVVVGAPGVVVGAPGVVVGAPGVVVGAPGVVVGAPGVVVAGPPGVVVGGPRIVGGVPGVAVGGGVEVHGGGGWGHGHDHDHDHDHHGR